MARRNRVWLSLLLICFTVSAIGWYAWNQSHHYRHLYTVKTGVLYRSGQLTRQGMLRVLYEKNIGTVINLRGPHRPTGKDKVDWEEELCFKNFTYYVALTMLPEEQRVHSPGEENKSLDEAVARFLDIMSDPVTYPRPILIHCQTGKERTGVLAALYRIECQGWSKSHALGEMRRLGYSINTTGYDPLRDYVLHWVPRNERVATPVSSATR